jgi:hypothetical protein
MPNDAPHDEGSPRTATLAGVAGDTAISPLASVLLAGVRAGRSWLQLAAELGLMPGEVYTELLPLVATRLLVFEDGEFRLVA